MYTGLASFGRTCCHAPSQVLDELVKKTLVVQALLQAGRLPDAVQHTCLGKLLLHQVRFKPGKTWSVLCHYPNFLRTYLLTPCLCFQSCFDALLAHPQPSEHCSAAWKILCAVRETAKRNSYKQARALGRESHLASRASALPSLRRWGSPISHFRKCEGPRLIQPLSRIQEALKVLAVLDSRRVWRVQGAAPEV